MGWSVDIVKPTLDLIFDSLDMRYTITHPQALSPRVFINHDGDMPVEAKQAIATLFPDFVSVEFFNTHILVTGRNKGRRIGE